MENKYLDKFSDEVKGLNLLGKLVIYKSGGGTFIVVSNKHEEAMIDVEFNLLGSI